MWIYFAFYVLQVISSLFAFAFCVGMCKYDKCKRETAATIQPILYETCISVKRKEKLFTILLSCALSLYTSYIVCVYLYLFFLTSMNIHPPIRSASIEIWF